MKYFALLLLLVHTSTKAEDLETKLPIETFLERSVGYVRQPAWVEWRKKSLIFAFEVGQAVEYNNFSNRSFGLTFRIPFENFVYKATAAKVEVSGTDASLLVAKTPFQQEGRASRYEMQHGLEIPFIEGIGQQLGAWLPQAQFVLSAIGQFNSYIYPGISREPLKLVKNLLKPAMSGGDRAQVESQAPPSMRVQNSLHSLGLGLQWNNYYRSGFDLNSRFLFEVPAGGDTKKLSSWYSLTLGVGYAF